MVEHKDSGDRLEEGTEVAGIGRQATVPDVASALRTGAAATAASISMATMLAACGSNAVDVPEGPVMARYEPLSASERPSAVSSDRAPSKVDAARFLTQATFGITSPEQVEALQAQGYAQWLWDQMRAPTLVHTSYLDWQRFRNAGSFKADEGMSYEAIWQQWIFGEDQLRARMAFALSQIMVVSNVAPDLPPYAMSSWMDMLNRQAFGTYRSLLEAVTKHAAMGYYLNMQGSAKEDPRKGIHPNENYAREVLQLFSIGLVQLGLDGTPKLDAQGRTIPTFDETVVKGYARAFTGWTVAGAKSFDHFDESDPNNWTQPMRAWPEHHESGEKRLLDGAVLAAGGTPEADLQAALDTIAAHPNVAPFISRQLIQRFVTSNPTPGYVARVASVFNDNGQGVRGDLGAVLQAVLLDVEARTPGLHANARFGKLREPVIRYANLLRGLGAKSKDGSNRIHDLSHGDHSLGQSPLLAPSVFNFYSPNFRPAGPMAQQGMVGPEFQITTEATLASSLNAMVSLVRHGGHGWGTGRVELDTMPWLAVSSSPTALVKRIDEVFFCGQMDGATRQRMQAMINQIPPGDMSARVRDALTLMIVSPDFVVQV